jgi:DNA-binding response OmpR family regulator
MMVNHPIINPMRILVIEDSKEISASLKMALEAECYVVDLADDGEKGSFLGRTNDYDVIILDYTLPKKDGLQVCKEIREDKKTVPIIMLSGRSEVETKAQLLNSGADDYITKPYFIEELFARIRALLRRPRVTVKEILTFGDLTLDSRRHLVKRANKEIILTKKEFMLLEYLMKHPREVLSRPMIMEHVWDMNADAFSNTLETHVLSLRKKLDIGFKTKLIHTVSGRGYKIDDLK